MRLIDASPFDGIIIKVPEDVFDACSFARGADAVLDLIREAPTVKMGEGQNEGQFTGEELKTVETKRSQN